MNDTRYTAIAAALREEFPKANNGTVSMALRSYAAEAPQTAPRKAHTVTVPVNRKHRTAR